MLDATLIATEIMDELKHESLEGVFINLTWKKPMTI